MTDRQYLKAKLNTNKSLKKNLIRDRMIALARFDGKEKFLDGEIDSLEKQMDEETVEE